MVKLIITTILMLFVISAIGLVSVIDQMTPLLSPELNGQPQPEKLAAPMAQPEIPTPVAKASDKLLTNSGGQLVVTKQLIMSSKWAQAGSEVQAIYTVTNTTQSDLTVGQLAVLVKPGFLQPGVEILYPLTGVLTLRAGESFTYRGRYRFDQAGEFSAEPIALINGSQQAILGGIKYWFGIFDPNEP